MSRLGRMLVAATLGAITLNVAPQATGPADAASCIKIYRIYYDSPGTDTGSNSSRNSEWIQLKNICASGKNLKGFKLRDTASHWYYFTSNFTLGAGKLVKIHTGSGTNSSSDRYWGSAYYIWNNDKDTAKLFNGAGTLIRTCSYNSTAVDVKTC